ncbi:MAG: hypothetical protein KOO69_07135 [Victivallales bacterium]|nr:hypothetical protein [Victivallales bacterium]
MNFKSIFNFFFSTIFNKKPKTIVCIGDSLSTRGGMNGKYTDYLQQLLPNQLIINKGISGDTLAGGRKRFKKDILRLHPDIVIIQLGANDYWEMKRSIDELQDDLEHMVRQCTDKKIKVLIASCFEKNKDTVTLQHKSNETKKELQRAKYALSIGEMETKIVKKYNCFYIPNIQVDINPNTNSEFWTDENHPNNLGNELVAQRILKELTKAIKQL